MISGARPAWLKGSRGDGKKAGKKAVNKVLKAPVVLEKGGLELTLCPPDNTQI